LDLSRGARAAAAILQNKEVVGPHDETDGQGLAMRLEEVVGEIKLRGGIRHMEWEIVTVEATHVIGASEGDKVAARLAGAGGVGEALLERRRCRSWEADKGAGISGIKQWAGAEGDGIAKGQILLRPVGGGEGAANA
jgi:hypothetical protein